MAGIGTTPTRHGSSISKEHRRRDLVAYLADETSMKTTSTANIKPATSEKIAC
jgi:hypothetical protein